MNTWRCVICKQWLSLPLRRQAAFKQNHIRTEHPEDWKRQQALKVADGFIPAPEATPVSGPDPLEARRELEALLPRLAELTAARDAATGVRKAQLANQVKALVKRLTRLEEVAS